MCLCSCSSLSSFVGCVFVERFCCSVCDVLFCDVCFVCLLFVVLVCGLCVLCVSLFYV